MKKENLIIPDIMWLPIFLALLCNTIAYYGARILTTERHHYNVSGCLGGKTPLVSWTIVIYWGCYLFWIVNYLIGCRQDQEKAFRFMSADFLAKVVCFLCFLVFPTTNTRPIIVGNTIWDELMRLLYRVDAADNLFPSIHCLTSYFCLIAVRDNPKISKWYRWASFLMMVSVCISTLTTRQHVLMDVIAGILLAEISWVFVEKSGFSKWYSKTMRTAYNGIEERRKCE